MNNSIEKQTGWELACYFKDTGPKSKFKLLVPNPTEDPWTFRETAAGIKTRHPGIVIVSHKEMVNKTDDVK